MINIDNKNKLQERLIQYRRELHRNPELSLMEFETTKRIREWLLKEGITIMDLPLPVGVVAEIEGEKEGPTIALRADIDALPIIEETNLTFSSQNHGAMHACGHDFHTAAILGAAIILNKNKAHLHGKVRLIFQPGEENAQGAGIVIEARALDGVSAILGMHNRPNLPVGTIGVKSGALMASVDRFEIEVLGVGGHAGIPEKCIDPIVVASQLVTGLQSLVSRSLSAFSNVVISITRFEAGTTWNVIPSKAILEGTVRTFQNDVRDVIPTLMKRAAEGIASAFGASINFNWYPYVPVVDNDDDLSLIAIETANNQGFTVVSAEQALIGEDFSLYQQLVPGLFVWIGVDGTQDLHHPAYILKEEALIIASEYFANLTLRVLDKIKSKEN